MFQLFFEKQLKSLLKKKRTKKILSVYCFLNQLKIALNYNFPLAIFYSKPYFFKILQILKNEFYIFNYFVIPHFSIPGFLQIKTTKFFLENLLCVIFRPNNLFGNLRTVNNIIFISTPSRNIYISYRQLAKLVNMNSSSLFLLNTTVGVVSHKTALKKKLGGSLLCKIS
jgi:ribosomal protein S8